MLIIKGGTIVTSKESFVGDICIEGEKIVEVRRLDTPDGDAAGPRTKEAACEKDTEAEIVNAAGKLVFPGFIDAHTHFDLHVAGTVTCDDFASGTKAAVSGGTTAIIDFGTQYPGETLQEGLHNWLEKAAVGCSCDYGIHMSITDWNPETARQCQDMMDAGVSTFKLYMTYDTQVDDKTLYEILVRLKEVGGITGVHCENSGVIDALREKLAAGDGLARVSSHCLSRPAAAEAEAIGRLLHLAGIAETEVIDVHLTCEEGLEEIRAARKRGQTVYAETCPQYLVMDDSLYGLPGFEGAKYVIAPPLRKPRDNAALWKALADGEIQTVATDHCAFTCAQKALGRDDFRKIPGGMPGVETRGLVIYSEGVARGRITKEKMCQVLAENPAKLYGLYPRKGALIKGADADIVILDPGRRQTVTAAAQQSRCDYAPLEGKTLTGVIEAVYLRGVLTASEGQVFRENRGVFLKRGKHQPLT
ncbi:MAG: dihydropyrimidinase [Eubacteriales bacterium]|nr:dihydropyrimidinase [Eubacteriales bacterium]